MKLTSLLTVAALMLAGLTVPAVAQECVTPEQNVTSAAEIGATSVIVISGSDVRPFLVAYAKVVGFTGDIEPTVESMDYLQVWALDGQMIVVTYKNGCAVELYPASAETLNAVIAEFKKAKDGNVS